MFGQVCLSHLAFMCGMCLVGEVGKEMASLAMVDQR